MDLSQILTFDTLTFCVFGAALAREIWCRMTPAPHTAALRESAIDHMFDIQFTPPPADGGPISATRRAIGHFLTPRNCAPAGNAA